MSTKLTKWFDATRHKPPRPGVYQVTFNNVDVWYSRWYRGRWCLAESTHYAAQLQRGKSGVMSAPQCFPKWRGRAGP